MIKMPTLLIKLEWRARLKSLRPKLRPNELSEGSAQAEVEKPGRIMLRKVCQEVGQTEPKKVRDSGHEC